jgi:hypothetical protein
MGRVGPTVLFNMTGKFGKDAALAAMSKAAGCFLMALEDMGGESPDDPKYYQIWGQSCGLPTAKSFFLLKNAMISSGWMVRPERSDGFHLAITPQGEAKATDFRKRLDPEATDGETHTA